MKVMAACAFASVAFGMWMAPASAAEAPQEFLYDFLPGHYRLVGQAPGAGSTYACDVVIERTAHGLSASRLCDDAATAASVTVEHATADAVPVLRIRFSDGSMDYEETCLVHSDLDNFPRLTCLLYDAQHMVGPAGLEAMFPQHTGD